MQDRFLKDVQELLETVPFGEISFSVHKHNERITNLITNINKTSKYGKEKNAEAVGAFIQQIGTAHDNKFSGSITVTFVMDEGEIKRTMTQGFKNINYLKDEK